MDRPQRRKQKAIAAVARVICEIGWILICDPAARFHDLGADYWTPHNRAAKPRARIREVERLNPVMKVILSHARRPVPRRTKTARPQQQPQADAPSIAG